MRDARTDEQRTADDALDAAIRACREAYSEETGTGLITEWVVTGSAIADDPDDTEGSTFVLLPDGGTNTIRPHILGMLRTAQVVVEAEIREGL